VKCAGTYQLVDQLEVRDLKGGAPQIAFEGLLEPPCFLADKDIHPGWHDE